MRLSRFLFAMLSVAPIAAQSPLVTSAVYRGNAGFGGSRWIQVYFDLTVNTPLCLTRIDTHVGPGQGTPRLDLYTCRGGYAANVANPAAWTLAGSSRVLPAGSSPLWSPADQFGVQLPAGTQGLCLCFQDCSPVVSTHGAAGMNYANADLAIAFGDVGYSASVSEPHAGNGLIPGIGPAVLDCAIHYRLGQGFAGYRVFGRGCLDVGSSFYESLAPGTFDLGGTATQTSSLVLVPTGTGGYFVGQGSNSWHAPTTPDLGLMGSGVSAVLPLGFSFPYPGGSTAVVQVAANGIVLLEPCGGCSGLFPSGRASFFGGLAQLAPMSQFLLSLGFGGSITFEVSAINQIAYATWDRVVDTSNARNTFQVAMGANGQVEFRYRACGTGSPSSGDILVGFTRGHGVPEVPPVDLSAALPFVTGADNHALVLLPDARPVLGGSLLLTSDNVPAASALGVLLLGAVGFDPGLDLLPLGMPGCRQYARGDALVPFAASVPSSSLPLHIPNTAALVGLHVFAQMATLSPGFNAPGVLASNGLDLQLGL